MSNVDNFVQSWARGVILSLEPVKWLLSLEQAGEADIKYAVKETEKLLPNHAIFGVSLARLFEEAGALEAHILGLLGAPEAVEEVPAEPETATDLTQAPEGKEGGKDEVPEVPAQTAEVTEMVNEGSPVTHPDAQEPTSNE